MKGRGREWAGDKQDDLSDNKWAKQTRLNQVRHCVGLGRPTRIWAEITRLCGQFWAESSGPTNRPVRPTTQVVTLLL